MRAGGSWGGGGGGPPRPRRRREEGRAPMTDEHPAPLRGKVALVTGAAKGLGAAITDALARDGAHIGLLGRDREALDGHAGTLDESHPERESLGIRCEVSDEGEIGPAGRAGG